MTTNVKRAAWARACLDLFADMTGAASTDHAIGDLIANLGHYAQLKQLNFLKLVQRGIGHWHLEQSDPESIDVLPTVTIAINPQRK